MNARVLVAIVVLAGVTGACAKPKVAPPPPRSDMIVLVPDPEDGRLGSVTVSAGGGSVELAAANHATRVAPGRAPTSPAPMAADEVRRIFGEAMSARPLQPKQYLLYFESGGDTLTAESQALLSDIVAFVRARPVPDVTVIGHTDTTGDSAANFQLGLQRATLIRDLLIKSGMDPAQVDFASHGEADLLIQTPDNTSEPKNRRVEVTIR
jgi:outer membrane protein OmpA-like peptidoglycan-associated protein